MVWLPRYAKLTLYRLLYHRRIFWDNGFKTVAAVANAEPQELLPILMQAQPNKVRLETRDEQRYKDKLLAKAKVICDSANRIWREYLLLHSFLSSSPCCRIPSPSARSIFISKGEYILVEANEILIHYLLQNLRCELSTRKNKLPYASIED